MAATVSIPNGLYSIGVQSYGPLDLADSDNRLRVDLDRTVNQGLNARTPTTSVRVLFEVSYDGGPWTDSGSTTFVGGIRSDPELGQLNSDYLDCSIPGAGQGMSRQLRCTVTVGGSSVRLAGSVSVGS